MASQLNYKRMAVSAAMGGLVVAAFNLSSRYLAEEAAPKISGAEVAEFLQRRDFSTCVEGTLSQIRNPLMMLGVTMEELVESGPHFTDIQITHTAHEFNTKGKKLIVTTLERDRTTLEISQMRSAFDVETGQTLSARHSGVHDLAVKKHNVVLAVGKYCIRQKGPLV